MSWYCIIILAFLTVGVLCIEYEPEDYKLPFKDLVEKHGYPFEEYQLVTPDGYILTTHRIPHGRSSTSNNKKPVLFVHGMGGSAENLFNLGPDRSLGFLMAENGFDVWLMNARGSFYSRRHKYLDPNGQKFWNYSWHEIGIIDTPLNIDYILNVTQQDQLYYIGHSQGATTYFVLTSSLPEYNRKIKLHISLAPPVLLSYCNNSPMKVLSRYIKEVMLLGRYLNLLEPFPPVVHEITKHFCNNPESYEMCKSLLRMVGNTKLNLVNKNIIPYIVRTTPSGLSLYQMVHYLQVYKSGQFQEFDYGPRKNLQMYNSTVPPIYDLKKSVAPVAILYSKNDYFASEKSVLELAKRLPNVVLIHEMGTDEFNHLDFIMASNAKEIIYDYLIDFMNNYL